MRLAFTLEYDGTDFSGFQSQKDVPTIQDSVEDALKKIEDAKSSNIESIDTLNYSENWKIVLDNI